MEWNFVLSNPEGKPPCLENWKNDTYLKLDNDKMSFTTTQWNFATARGTVFVSQGRWYNFLLFISFQYSLIRYYDLTVKSSGQARIGWCSQNYAPESTYVGCGSDQDSWGWDGSSQKAYHDEKKNSSGKTYGEYWNAYDLSLSCLTIFLIYSNDIIGTSIDFDLNEIRYYRNGKDMGVAFRANKFPALHPCIRYSIVQRFFHFRIIYFLVSIVVAKWRSTLDQPSSTALLAIMEWIQLLTRLKKRIFWTFSFNITVCVPLATCHCSLSLLL